MKYFILAITILVITLITLGITLAKQSSEINQDNIEQPVDLNNLVSDLDILVTASNEEKDLVIYRYNHNSHSLDKIDSVPDMRATMSPDGKFIYYTNTPENGVTKVEVYKKAIGQPRESAVQILSDLDSSSGVKSISPNNKYIEIISNDTGKELLYVNHSFYDMDMNYILTTKCANGPSYWDINENVYCNEVSNPDIITVHHEGIKKVDLANNKVDLVIKGNYLFSNNQISGVDSTGTIIIAKELNKSNFIYWNTLQKQIIEDSSIITVIAHLSNVLSNDLTQTNKKIESVEVIRPEQGIYLLALTKEDHDNSYSIELIDINSKDSIKLGEIEGLSQMVLNNI